MIIANITDTKFEELILYIWEQASQTLPPLDFLKREDFSRQPKEHYASTWEVEPELLSRLKTKQQAAFIINLRRKRFGLRCHLIADIYNHELQKAN